MKKIILLAILFTNILFASNALQVFTLNSEDKISFKWFPENYSEKNIYKIYRSSSNEPQKLIATVKATSYDELLKRNYSEENLDFIYPSRNVKTLDDKLKVLKDEQEMLAGFRYIKALIDNSFAKDLGQYYIDDKVKKGVQYSYTIELFKDDTKLSSKTLKRKAINPEPYSGISYIRANNTINGVGLTWAIGNTQNFFNIYRKLENESEFQKLNTLPFLLSPSSAHKAENLYEDQTLKSGEKASYYVRKVNKFGIELPPSDVVKGERLIPKKNLLVKGLFVKNRDNKITLRWEKLPTAVSYNVYRSTIYDANYKKMNDKPLTQTVFFDRNFKTGRDYYYYVTAVNTYGESKPSRKMLAHARDVTPPSIVHNLSSEVKAGEINLSWDKVEDKNLFGYKIYISMDDNAEDWSLLTKEAVPTNSYLHKRSKTLSRHFYYYRVTAVDKNFNESAPSNMIKVKLPDVTLPLQPTIMKFAVYPKKLVLKWNKIIVYDLSHYNVYSKIGGKLKKLNEKPLYNTTFESVVEDTQEKRDILVTAVDTSGNESLMQKHITINPQDTKAPTIKNLTFKQTKDGLKISFDVEEKDFNGFEVLKSSGSLTKYTKISEFVKAKNFTDKKVSKGKTYWYRIKVYDNAGNMRVSDTKEVKIL